MCCVLWLARGTTTKLNQLFDFSNITLKSSEAIHEPVCNYFNFPTLDITNQCTKFHHSIMPRGWCYESVRALLFEYYKIQYDVS